MEETRHDLLLTYLSEKGRGSWQDLKNAWQWINEATEDPLGKAWIAARDLEALGHIEVAWNHGLQWCAAPTMFTMIPRSGGRAFVTGARTRHFATELITAAEHEDAWVDECFQRGPTTLYLAADSHLVVEAIATKLCVGYTYQVAEQIAGLLPPLDTYLRITDARELPRGLELEMFDPERLEWAATEQREDPGFYRCTTYDSVLHGLLGPTRQWNRVDKEIGIYEVLRWTDMPVLSYSAKDEVLTVPAEASLPALHARAATLCSGRLPRYQPAPEGARQAEVRAVAGTQNFRGGQRRRVGRGTLAYVNIPEPLATHIADTLTQRLDQAFS
jgi:hypothetical protein